jgi:uncharacterized protein (DUF433 family)
MKSKPLISREKKSFNGLPFLRGSWVTVKLIKFYYRKGYSTNEIKNLYNLTDKQVKTAIEFCRRKEKIK